MSRFQVRKVAVLGRRVRYGAGERIYVAGTEALRLEVQKLRGEVSALNERALAQKPPKAEEPKKPARKAPQAPQQPSGLFSFFPTSWEPTVSWEATVVDHRPRRQ